MTGSQKVQTLKEKFRQIVIEKTEEVKKIWPKLDIENENFPLFAGKILIGNIYFRFRCRLTKEGRGFFDKLKGYSNGYCLWLDDETVEIAINDEKKLDDFLGPGNRYVKDGSIELII